LSDGSRALVGGKETRRFAPRQGSSRFALAEWLREHGACGCALHFFVADSFALTHRPHFAGPCLASRASSRSCDITRSDAWPALRAGRDDAPTDSTPRRTVAPATMLMLARLGLHLPVRRGAQTVGEECA
jgi:hypothetical protein